MNVTTTTTRKQTSHAFHLLMCVFTFGMWIPVWFFLIIWHHIGPKSKSTSITTSDAPPAPPSAVAAHNPTARERWTTATPVQRYAVIAFGVALAIYVLVAAVTR